MNPRLRGRQAALGALGFKDNVPDNPILQRFVKGLPEHEAKRSMGTADTTRPLHRQSWGKRMVASTSNEEFSGGGVRR